MTQQRQQQHDGGRKHSFVLDTDISAFPELGGISIIGIVLGMVGWAIAFTAGTYVGGFGSVGGVLRFLACLAVPLAGTVLAFILAGVTPSYCTMKDYMDQRHVEKNNPSVRVLDTFSRGGE